jgi:hypothetical protein
LQNSIWVTFFRFLNCLHNFQGHALQKSYGRVIVQILKLYVLLALGFG